MATYLSANEAAQMAGVSPKTVRRWLQSGRLTGVKRGRSFRIPVDQIAPMVDDSGQDDESDVGPDSRLQPFVTHSGHVERATVNSGQETPGTASPMAVDGLSDSSQAVSVGTLASASLDQPLLEALRLLDRVQRENIELAGRLGFLQAELRQRDDTIRALQPPQPGPMVQESSEDAVPRQEAPGGSWWRRWFLA